ncbi:hypothetical protein EON64_16735, partial [archaeon]
MCAATFSSAQLRGIQHANSNDSAAISHRRRLAYHNNLRRIIQILPDKELYVLEKELQLKLINTSLPFAEHWVDLDEAITISRENATAFYRHGTPISHVVDWLEGAVHRDPYSPLPLDPKTLSRCPCGDVRLPSEEVESSSGDDSTGEQEQKGVVVVCLVKGPEADALLSVLQRDQE